MERNNCIQIGGREKGEGRREERKWITCFSDSEDLAFISSDENSIVDDRHK